MNSIVMKLLPVLIFPLLFEPNASEIKYQIAVICALDSAEVVQFRYFLASTDGRENPTKEDLERGLGHKMAVTPFKMSFEEKPFLLHFRTVKTDDQVTITLSAPSTLVTGTGSSGTIFAFPPKGGHGYYGSRW